MSCKTASSFTSADGVTKASDDLCNRSNHQNSLFNKKTIYRLFLNKKNDINQCFNPVSRD